MGGGRRYTPSFPDHPSNERQRRTLRSPIVYCGPMWGGKTEGLITRLVRARIQNVRVLAFSPSMNTRDGENTISSHSGGSFPALRVEKAESILEYADQADVIGIDEIFMLSDIAPVVRKLMGLRKKIVMATLDMDSEGKVWDPVGEVLGLAEEVVKCPAVCTQCKHDAYYTFRLPEAPNDRVLVGAGDFYEPRCFSCWAAGQDEKKLNKGQKKFFATTPKLPG